ncbi:phosphate ABC transporter ATP-binding protein [Haloarculaceae archaeon H-GB2-1]|nr:phosphate ABC transporter ATP-binding protein [Haloarculaceae archaeon H-GB1-1]MEA5388856.1 phosphate ABC transporter ATP-binding protein [Haloarculaceae archaeon H-GB11]MEA5406912.1 phosphate ABC transporter ATP-binding protein [Haloarculaceae archaeon H-GB2-1]
MTLSAATVSVSYGPDTVLNDVSLGVEAGEVVTVVGPSGTGKTTLLRLLGMFRRPDDGTITWNDTDVWGLSETERLAVRRRISMVFQEPSLFNAPVAQNVTYGQRVREPWRERIRKSIRNLVGDRTLSESARDALDTVGLLDKADQNALSLSGGEAQRVAFARALAVDPEIVLLDEPSSNLDPRNTAVLEDAIRRARERGVGVVVATHDMNQAERISDRVGFIYDGKLVETGPPSQIFDTPNDSRTKQFVDGELMYDVEETTNGQARKSTSVSP